MRWCNFFVFLSHKLQPTAISVKATGKRRASFFLQLCAWTLLPHLQSRTSSEWPQNGLHRRGVEAKLHSHGTRSPGLAFRDQVRRLPQPAGRSSPATCVKRLLGMKIRELCFCSECCRRQGRPELLEKRKGSMWRDS